jgi:hypothetical protein
MLIPSALVDLVLLGPADDRRQLQDSPILGDVWIAYAAEPLSRQDLLITPHKRTTAGRVAKELTNRLADTPEPTDESRQIAYLQGLVAARLSLREMLRVIVPLTLWWNEQRIRQKLTERYDESSLSDLLRSVLQSLQARAKQHPRGSIEPNFSSLDRYLALAGLLLWAGSPRAPQPPKPDTPVADDVIRLAINDIGGIVAELMTLYSQMTSEPADATPADKSGEQRSLIFQVSLNRLVSPALERSVPAVKADAVHHLFKVKANKIAWAVVDSGISETHLAFQTEGRSRVQKTFDFTRVRQLLSGDNDKVDLSDLVKAGTMTQAEIDDRLRQLNEDSARERSISWDVIEELLTLSSPPPPSSVHGTHVAGIIGACKHADDASYADGMCPDIQLYDFRVLARTPEDTEFAVIAALQYIRYVNERHSYITIHGANLSLSIPHNVRNYACGRTPICNECQRLIESGVVVVAAAGNRGYQRFETKEGLFESYAAFSITDPGNADDVITVGATHGNWPHTYGVSFFSSRGPTGDGRLKPDLVAPGERIRAPIPSASNDESGAESGTSMAAPHVSGAAAMLMARYPELVGNPRRIKRILCDSATDLGRERSFQGHGMLDVLRAFQSI